MTKVILKEEDGTTVLAGQTSQELTFGTVKEMSTKVLGQSPDAIHVSKDGDIATAKAGGVIVSFVDKDVYGGNVPT